MGEFEVNLSFKVRAEDRFDAARRIYAMIEAAPPRTFWVCNEGGVGDEVRLTGERISHADIGRGATPENIFDLLEDLYRLGVQFGAGSTGLDEAEHEARVDDVKKRLLATIDP
jgi:hypothetical protein